MTKAINTSIAIFAWVEVVAPSKPGTENKLYVAVNLAPLVWKALRTIAGF